MKKKLLVVMLATALTMSACSQDSISENQGSETVANGATEIKEIVEHSHAYTESVTVEATCETDGEKTFTCDCGDSYTESIAAEGHLYENYVYNKDATYLADGTETAKCNGCDLTDTRKAEGTKLEYTYTDISATKYVKKSVNVRSLPCTDGEKLGSLEMNDKVKVTGQCNETNWYRIEFDGTVAYVSNNYLVNEKVVVAVTPVPTPVESSDNGSNTSAGSDSVSVPSAPSNDVGSDSSVNPSENNSSNVETPEPKPSVPETETPAPAEPVKNPEGYPEATFAEVEAGTLAPGTYYLVDTDQVVTIVPPTSGGQTENSSGVIIDGDTGEILNPGHP